VHGNVLIEMHGHGVLHRYFSFSWSPRRRLEHPRGLDANCLEFAGKIACRRDVCLPRAFPRACREVRVKLLEFMLGKPIPTDADETERVGPLAGVGILGLDALGSAAYGPEALLTALMPLGAGALGHIGALTAIIMGLLVLLGASYSQTIGAYPNGAGAYIVAKENLGTRASLIAAAALSLDYILNVAVASDVVDEIARRHKGRPIAVVVPELVESRGYHHLLHGQTAVLLRQKLRARGGPRLVIVNTPWYLREWLPEKRWLSGLPRRWWRRHGTSTPSQRAI
jgi:hypothetical protein